LISTAMRKIPCLFFSSQVSTTPTLPFTKLDTVAIDLGIAIGILSSARCGTYHCMALRVREIAIFLSCIVLHFGSSMGPGGGLIGVTIKVLLLGSILNGRQGVWVGGVHTRIKLGGGIRIERRRPAVYFGVEWITASLLGKELLQSVILNCYWGAYIHCDVYCGCLYMMQRSRYANR